MKTYSYRTQRLRNDIVKSLIQICYEVDYTVSNEILQIKAILDNLTDSSHEVNKMIDELNLENKIDFYNDEFINGCYRNDETLLKDIENYMQKAIDAWECGGIEYIGLNEDLVALFVENYTTFEQYEFYEVISDLIDKNGLADKIINEELVPNIVLIDNEYYQVNI